MEQAGGAQLLHEVAGERQRVVPGRGEAQVLGPDADLDLAARGGLEGIGGKAMRPPAVSTTPGPATLPGTRFMAGEPMKVATKRVAGRR